VTAEAALQFFSLCGSQPNLSANHADTLTLNTILVNDTVH
jgi:hypothetical protein